jgi:hypothetical protein
MPDPNVAPGTGVMEGIAPTLRGGAAGGYEEAILAASPTAGRTAPPPAARAWLNHHR